MAIDANRPGRLTADFEVTLCFNASLRSALKQGRANGPGRRWIAAGPCVGPSLEAALWSVGRSNAFKDAVLLAANLGDDADTTAAIAGQLAGAFYGASGLPDAWRAKVA